MIKLNASKKWFLKVASEEPEAGDISAGSFIVENNKEARKINEEGNGNLHVLKRKEGFAALLRMLRLNSGYTFENLAKTINEDENELMLLEKRVGHKASPRTLIALARLYKIPVSRFLQIGGAAKEVDRELNEEVVKFAAESESFDKLTKEEKKLLKKIIKILGKE